VDCTLIRERLSSFGELELGNLRSYIGVFKQFYLFRSYVTLEFLSPLDRIRRKFQLIVFSFRFPFHFASFVISLSPFFDLVHCNFPFKFLPHVYNNSDELVIKLTAVETPCAVDFYTVVDTTRSPVYNTPCPLHWVRGTTYLTSCHHWKEDKEKNV